MNFTRFQMEMIVSFPMGNAEKIVLNMEHLGNKTIYNRCLFY